MPNISRIRISCALCSRLRTRVKTHCGLRPMVADDGMITGRVDSFKNLSLLVGPGLNGLKLGFGAAALLARSLKGETPEVLDQSVMDAFSPKNYFLIVPIDLTLLQQSSILKRFTNFTIDIV